MMRAYGRDATFILAGVRHAMRCVFLLLLSLPTCAPASAPEEASAYELSNQGPALTLQAAIAAAETNSPNLREAAEQIESARGRAVQAGLYPNPSVQGGAMQLAGSDSQYFSMLTQEIVTKGKLRLDRAAACKEVEQAELRFLRVRFDLLTAVRQAFFTALAAQERKQAQERLADVARQSSQSARGLERGGEATEADVLLLENEQAGAEVALENAGALLSAALRQLAAAIGDRERKIDRVEGNLSEPFSEDVERELRRQEIGSNALVRVAQVDVERMRLLLQRASVQAHPNITLGAGYIYQVAPPHNMAALQAEIPIPVWNRNQGYIRAARANVSAAVETVGRTENELASKLALAVGKLEAAEQQVRRYEESILPKTRRMLDLFNRARAQGQTDLLRLLQAQRALTQSELGYVNAQEGRWTAAADVANILQVEKFP